MGITKRDIKVLQQTSSREFRLAATIGLGVAILVFLLNAMNDIRLCLSFAAMADLNFGQIFSIWIKGVPASQASLEIVLLATQRLEMTLISLAVVAILAVSMWTLLAAANRNARILQSLKGKRR